MPRGVYDRSKTKAQRAAEKKTAAPAAPKAAKAAKGPKKQYNKKAKASAPGIGIGQAFVQKNDTFFLMQEVRANLGILAAVRERFGEMPSVKAEVESHIELLGQLRESLGKNDESEADEAPASTNGTTATPPPVQASVPLPPPVSVPVPPMPTH